MFSQRLEAARRKAQRGYLIVELIIYLGLVALLAVYANGRMARDSEETLAQGSAAYLATVATAAQSLVMMNFTAYSNNTPVAGVATLLAPTLAELRTLGRLTSAFPVAPNSMPTRQSVQVNIIRTGCPGAGCTVTAVACTTTPVTLGGADIRFDLAATMMSSQSGGTGGLAAYGTGGGTIRGPVLSVANPLGAVEGIVCGSGVVDAGIYASFLQVADTRNPNFQGSFSVAGTSAFAGAVAVANDLTVSNNLTVTGAASFASGCARILAATGRAGFGCADPNDLPAGYTGGARAPDVVVSGSVLASTAPAAFTGANGNYAYVGVAGGVGEVRTSGRAVADRILPTGSYAAGAACAAADEGAIARGNPNGLVTCRSSAWRTLMEFAALGGACGPNGAMADDGTGAKLLCAGGAWRAVSDLFQAATPGAACAQSGHVAYDTANANEALLCRTNPAGGGARWMRLRDVTTNLVFVQSYEVTDIGWGGSGQVSKPVCSPAAGMSATSVIQLVPKAYASSDGGFAAYAIDTGAVWQVFLRNGSGGLLTGSPNARALANVFCFYA
ncbi:hypothetical protein [Ramlibacter sp. AN1133]|uniref:hypothetical protein n=1 Tax=Ramlibacter sp. AN1133 TaxID=3133429 RepID=UPI0030C48AD8